MGKSRTTNKNILVIYTNYGTGHYMAAKAIEEYIKKYHSTYTVTLFDPLSFSRPMINRFFRFVGRMIATRFRRFRNKVYQKKMYQNYLKQSWFFSFCIHLFWTKKLRKKLFELNPSIVISTQVGPTGLIAAHKDLFQIKLISVATDYGIHRMYTVCHSFVDLFCVPTIDLKNQMVDLGIDHKKIIVTGIPVRLSFTSEPLLNKTAFLKEHQIPAKQPLFLFLCGGGLGYDNAFPYFKKLLESDLDFSYIFVSGKNETLYQKANELAKQYEKVGIVYPFIEQIDNIMRFSDLVIGKPGGILTTEALNLGVPFCTIEPIPGQEINNAKFIELHHFGYYIKNITDFQLFLERFKKKEISLKVCRKNIEEQFQKFEFSNIIDS